MNVQVIGCLLIWVQGMSEDVSINKFFDEAMVAELALQAAELHQQMM